MLAGIALLIVGALANSAVLIILGLVLGGVSYGGSSSAYSAAIKRVYGGKYYSANYGFANLSMGLGALISAFSGIVLDAHGGDYMSRHERHPSRPDPPLRRRADEGQAAPVLKKPAPRCGSWFFENALLSTSCFWRGNRVVCTMNRLYFSCTAMRWML